MKMAQNTNKMIQICLKKMYVSLQTYQGKTLLNQTTIWEQSSWSFTLKQNKIKQVLPPKKVFGQLWAPSVPKCFHVIRIGTSLPVAWVREAHIARWCAWHWLTQAVKYGAPLCFQVDVMRCQMFRDIWCVLLHSLPVCLNPLCKTLPATVTIQSVSYCYLPSGPRL